MPTTTSVAALYLSINWASSGWTERYFLPELSWPAAIATAEEIARWRIAACATGCKLIWARLSFTDQPTLTEPLRCIGITSTTYTGSMHLPLHAPWRCLHYRFETAAGQWATRLFRGIPDAAVKANELVTALPPLPDSEDLPDLADPLNSWVTVYRGFLRVIRDRTIHASVVPGSEPRSYRTAGWHAVQFRKVCVRDTGRDFLRVSWHSAETKPPADPGIDPPTLVAPAFHPCGAAVGVVRSAYTQPARWYVGGPVGRIRFYFVPESNHILWKRTRFWPYSQQLDISNTDPRTGVLTIAPRRYDKGFDVIGADGSMPHGDDADFAGEKSLPWAPQVNTPPELIPTCSVLDMGDPPEEPSGGGCSIGGGVPAVALAGGAVYTGGDNFNDDPNAGAVYTGGENFNDDPNAGGVYTGGEE